MRRPTLLALGVAVALGLSLQIGGSAEAAASNFTVTQACSETGVGVDVRLNWQGANASARETWVDVSEYNNGWIPDTFATTGAISPNQSSFKWVSLLPNTAYYVRVSQWMAPGFWDTSLTYVFVTGPGCFGANAPAYSTPWNYANTYSAAGYANTYGAGGYGHSQNTGSYVGGSSSRGSSFSLQPLDFWVRAARVAQFLPPRERILVNMYPTDETFP